MFRSVLQNDVVKTTRSKRWDVLTSRSNVDIVLQQMYLCDAMHRFIICYTEKALHAPVRHKLPAAESQTVLSGCGSSSFNHIRGRADAEPENALFIPAAEAKLLQLRGIEASSSIGYVLLRTIPCPQRVNDLLD